jgi:hypothetical protein
MVAQVRRCVLAVALMAGCGGSTDSESPHDDVRGADSGAGVPDAEEVDVGDTSQACVDFEEEWPLSRHLVVYVVDVSDSMGTAMPGTDESPLDAAAAALLRGPLGPYAGLAWFPDGSGCFSESDAVPVGPMTETHRERVDGALRALTPQGDGAPLLDALRLGHDQLGEALLLIDPRDQAYPAVVVITDGGFSSEPACGESVNDAASLVSLVQQAEERGISTEIIGFPGSEYELELLWGISGPVIDISTALPPGEDCLSCWLSERLEDRFREGLQSCEVLLPPWPEGRTVDFNSGQVILTLADDSTRVLSREEWRFIAVDPVENSTLVLFSEACGLLHEEARAVRVTFDCVD